MDILEEVPAKEDIKSEVDERFEVFVRAFVSEIEEKLEEYAKEAKVGGTGKSGKIADKVVSPVVGSIGAAAGASAGLLAGVSAGAVAGPLALGRVGASIGKGVGEKIIATGSKFFSGKDHRKKAKKITQIFQTVKTDELRKLLVEAASLIYYSFQSQFEGVTDADGNWRRALSKLAIDARNRSISYLHNETIEQLSKDLLTKAVILGDSKDSYLSHVTPKNMQQIIPGTKPGHTVKNESKEWKTSDIYEKVGIKIVGNNGKTKYYKKKMCGNDYGYRWAFNWENDSSWMSTYEEDCSDVSEYPRTSLKLEVLEDKMDQVLGNINKEDPKLQLDRIEDRVDTVMALQKDIEPMKEDLHEIKSKLSLGLSKSDQPKIFNVTSPVKTFTGRERELTLLHDKLQTNQSQVVVSQCASISGLGGMGKSELARKYAHTYHASYGSCIWIDSETLSSITRSFHRLAEKLQIPITQKSSESEKPVERNMLFIAEDIYERFSRSKNLFIFDNVNYFEEIKDFLPSNLFPTDEKPTIIITSRNSDWDIGDEGEVGLILLDQFTAEEALSFVKKVLEIEDKDKSHDSLISELTKELSCFPLALRQAASYIKAKTCLASYIKAIENYLLEFRDEKKKRDLLKYKTKRDRYTETTYTTWQITFKNIEKDEANGSLAIRFVEIIAYLQPDEIPLGACTELEKNKKKLKEAVDILIKYSIISVKEDQEEYNEEWDEDIFFYAWHVANIHRLVQQVIRLWLQDGKREEEVLRAALTQIDDDLDLHHAAMVWPYACNYTALIDKYFCKIYEETKSYNKLVYALNYLVKEGDVRTIQKLLNYLESRSDLWREISYHILNKCSFKFNHNDASMENTDHQTHVKAVVLFHTEVYKALKHSNTKDLELFLKSFDKRFMNSCFQRHTALETSAESGNLNVVKILVENGVDVKLPSGGPYASNSAEATLNENHPKVVEYLLDQGADSNATGKEDWTVLKWASYYGHLNIVKRLVHKIAKCENGAEVDWSPLRFAARRNHVDIVEFLINHEVYRSAMKDHGQPVCQEAAESGSVQVVKYLLDNKLANVNGRDCKNETLLTFAVNNNQFDIVQYLLSDETPDKVDINTHNVLGSTPLFQAVLRGNVQIARFLIEHGAAVDSVQNGNTLLGQLNISALHLAATSDFYLDIVELLVEKSNADINRGLSTTFSPLQVATYFHSEDVCELLIKNGADSMEWSEAYLEHITRIIRNFCKELHSDVDYIFSECRSVLSNLKRNTRMYHNHSEDVEKLFETLVSYLEKLELDILLDQGG